MAGEPLLPQPRGPVSGHVVGHLRRMPHDVPPGPLPGGDPLQDDDVHLALYVLYELHYRGFAGVDDGWEWEPSLLAERKRLEDVFEGALRARVDPVRVRPDRLEDALRARIAADDAPSLARFIETRATLDQVREFMVHRSPYQLKEADPHTWGIPRIAGAAKAAMVAIQADEYGGGRPDLMHSELFAVAMREIGLDPTYGAYLDLVPGVSLAAVNLMSFLGLHRRWRGAIVGHLAGFEMTSCLPNRRYGNGLRRLGLGPVATAFYDEHVEADAVHDVLAAHDLAQGLAEQEPALAGDIILGAASLLTLDALGASYVLERWERGETSLLAPLEASVPAPAL